MTTTRIDITARDSTAAAFASVDSNLSKLTRGVNTVTTALGALGIGFSGFTVGRAIINATTDMERFTNAMTVATGSAQAAANEMSFVRAEANRLGLDLRSTTEQYASLAAAARGTTLEGQATRDIFTAVAQAATVMGLSSDQASGSLLAIQQIISKGTVSAEELRGQLGERLPGAFQIAARSIGVTTQELDKLLRTGSLTAEELLPALAIELNNTFGPQAEEAAAGLNAQINRFNTALFDLKIAAGQTGIVDLFTESIQVATALANVVSARVLPALQSVAEKIGLISSSQNTGTQHGSVLWFLNELAGGSENASKEIKEVAGAIDQLDKSNSLVRSKPEVPKEFINALKEEVKQRERLAKIADRARKDEERRLDNLREEGRRLAESVDPLIKRNNELERYKFLLYSGVIDRDIFDLAAKESIEQYINALDFGIDKTEELKTETQELGRTTRDIFGDTEQYAIQAARSIQSSLANALVNSFSDFKDFGGNILGVFKRMAGEIASTNILRGLGVGSLFGFSGAASASTGAFDLTSIGSGASSLFSSGFGFTNLVGSGISGLGSLTGSGSLTAFGQAFTGDSIAAFAGQAGSLGATLGSFAGPAAIAFAGTQILKSIAGDKRLGGGFGDFANKIGDIPVLGQFAFGVPLVNALFGRGAPKFNREDLLGSVSSSGFEGVFNTGFKEKGGLARSSRFSNFIIDTDTGALLNQFGRLSESGNIPGGLRDAATDPAIQKALQVGELLDTTFGALGQTLSNTADLLGISKEALNSFNAQIDIVSEKGQAITQEQIGAEIERISDEMITSLIPSINELGKSGENSAATLTRLGGQFTILQNALQLFGSDAESAADSIRTLSLEQQTSLVDSFGGVQVLSAELSDFYDNVFTDSQKLDFTKQRILDILKPLGVDFVPTLGQIYNAVKSGNPEFVNAGFAVDGLVVEFNRLNETLNSTQSVVSQIRDLSVVNSAFSELERAVQAERNQLTKQYNIALRENNSEIQRITQSLSALNSLSNALNQTIESINPVGLNAARLNISAAIASAKSGNVIDLQSVRGSLNALTSTDTSGFGSRVDFLRSQAQNSGLVREFSSVVDRQISAAESNVDQLETANSLLTAGFNAEQNRLDSILENAKQQLDALNGIAELLSVSDAQSAFNSAVNDARFPFSNASGSIRSDRPIRTIGAEDVLPGTNNITPNTIRDFFATAPSPLEIYNAARENNVSSAFIASALGIGTRQVEDFFASNPSIPRFASGSSFVPKTGPAIVHKGERIINPQQNKDLIDAVKELVQEVREMKEHTRISANILDNVSAGGSAFLTEAA